MGQAELYSIIGFLVLALLTLSGLWVRAHDAHRAWATGKITEHERVIAIVEGEFKGVREDVAEMKSMLHEHTRYDRKFQAAVASKLGVTLEVE